MGLFIAFGLSFWLAMVGFSLVVYRQETKQPVREPNYLTLHEYTLLFRYWLRGLKYKATRLKEEQKEVEEIEEAEIIPEESNVFEWNEVYYSRNEKEEIISFEIVEKK